MLFPGRLQGPKWQRQAGNLFKAHLSLIAGLKILAFLSLLLQMDVYEFIIVKPIFRQDLRPNLWPLVEPLAV